MRVKKVNVKLEELRRISGSLRSFLSKEMPIKQAYRMTKLAKLFDNELKTLEEQRILLVKKHGEKNKDGNMEVTTNIEAFNAELNELLKEEVEISYIPINLNEVGQLAISPIELSNIEMFIDEASIEDKAEDVTGHFKR